MGSFYSTCSITDLSITDGDQMYMQLILPSWVTNPHSIDGERIGCGEKGLRVSNEGPLGEFVPFGFPIAGHYADYGDIGGIVKNRNIEMLEEFFGISIEDIISCATDDRWYEHSYKPQKVDKTKEEYEGQHESWTVGDNKMKHINILKKLTVTYFRKEHYDFLSKESIASGGWSEGERSKRLQKMIKALGELEAKKPKTKTKEFTKKDITEELRNRFKEIFGEDGSDDESIIQLQNHKDKSWWYDFQYTFYIPSIATTNMFQLLPIGPQDEEQVVKQYTFIMNMSNLYKVLRPSYYGSQEDNYDAYVKFHEMTTNLVNEKKMNLKQDIILDEIGYYLKYTLKDIKNPELVDKILNGIKESLEEGYGYKLKI